MEKWSGYPQRSLVNTKMRCIKLFGDKLSTRNFQSQVVEIYVPCALNNARVLNRFSELDRTRTRIVV